MTKNYYEEFKAFKQVQMSMNVDEAGNYKCNRDWDGWFILYLVYKLEENHCFEG